VQQSGSFSSAFVISAVVAACSALAYFALLKEPAAKAPSLATVDGAHAAV
jgi:hypothetical protein